MIGSGWNLTRMELGEVIVITLVCLYFLDHVGYTAPSLALNLGYYIASPSHQGAVYPM